MLIAQISDMHVKAEGKLLYRRIDTAGFLERAVAHVNALDPRPDIVIATGDGDKALASDLKKGAPLALLSKPYDSDDLRKSLATVGLE